MKVQKATFPIHSFPATPDDSHQFFTTNIQPLQNLLGDIMYTSNLSVSSENGRGNGEEIIGEIIPENSRQIFAAAGNARPVDLPDHENEFLKRMMRESLEEMLTVPGYMQLAKARSLNMSPNLAAAFEPNSRGVNFSSPMLPGTAEELEGLPTPSEDFKRLMTEKLEYAMTFPEVMHFAKAQAQHSPSPASPPTPSAVENEHGSYHPPSHPVLRSPFKHQDKPVREQEVYNYVQAQDHRPPQPLFHPGTRSHPSQEPDEIYPMGLNPDSWETFEANRYELNNKPVGDLHGYTYMQPLNHRPSHPIVHPGTDSYYPPSSECNICAMNLIADRGEGVEANQYEQRNTHGPQDFADPTIDARFRHLSDTPNPSLNFAGMAEYEY
ncbi:hypothetical protein PTTG_07201 [Puccinia triticina 1-1 BBBD Race 1]|uniref:Uncharacterized protein n=2 Tax=Puccinia triticina TaxID=208348 RepID=A0A0C4F280_PUCT1|nr:uncharacterized protein PtA15_11A279 [Puccinia triticina]OAV95233.1 hypothetical protein PTTG_07201 [Puccinia triticina 1-1 BBBD Race 1]WAQ89589.1 hypothetical protein PtA15_11A279 [Puccinia triticina]WAR59620.1 hypothetical protein PtB15_11B260 [Puccinia triticina]